MYEVQIQIRDAQVRQCLIQCPFHVLWVVLVVPQLASEPDLLSWHSAPLERCSDFPLIAVDRSPIDVAISGSERSLDGLTYFVWPRLKSTKANRWDETPIVEAE